MLVMMSLLPGRVASEDDGEVEDGSTADFGIEVTLPSGVHPIRREYFNVWSDAVLRAGVDDQAEGSPEGLDATGTRKLSDEPAAEVVTVRGGAAPGQRSTVDLRGRLRSAPSDLAAQQKKENADGS